MIPIWRSQWNGGFAGNSDPSQATPNSPLSAQVRRGLPLSAMSASRRLRPSLGNGRLPDFHCKSVAIAPLAPYAPKAKTASECGEVPTIGSKRSPYLIVVIGLYD